MKNRSKGFSLIELIVVIGVIVVLGSMITGGVTILREKGRNVKCQNNLKQLGVQLQTSIDENRGRVPYKTDVASDSAWFNMLLSGMGQATPKSKLESNNGDGSTAIPLLICPSHRLFDSSSRYLSSYALNDAIAKDNGNLRISKIKDTSTFVFLFETMKPTIETIAKEDVATIGNFCHRNMANVCFVDGHVEGVVLEDAPNFIWSLDDQKKKED